MYIRLGIITFLCAFIMPDVMAAQSQDAQDIQQLKQEIIQLRQDYESRIRDLEQRVAAAEQHADRVELGAEDNQSKILIFNHADEFAAIIKPFFIQIQ